MFLFTCGNKNIKKVQVFEDNCSIITARSRSISMKVNLPGLVISTVLILLLAGCNLPNGTATTPTVGVVATKVASTLNAMTLSPQQSLVASPKVPTFTILAPPTITQTLTPTFTPTFTKTAGPSPTITRTPKPSETPVLPPGTITGSIIGYPYGSVPGLAIVAFLQEAPYNHSYAITVSGQTYYENYSEWLIPGHYQVVAYDSSGHTGGCTTLVLVISNQTVICDISNWGGGYRAKPSDVPNP
jgi:hypothetical protein